MHLIDYLSFEHIIFLSMLPFVPQIEGEGNFERGGVRASVKELVKKLQQKKLNS